MPLSIFNKLGLKDVKPTNVTLQLTDRLNMYPMGVVEDVLVKVNKLIFSADFSILDFEEDKDIPIILGRLFLATGRILIDVQQGELTMRVNIQEVKFNVYKAIKFPNDVEDCSLANESYDTFHKDSRDKVGLKTLVGDKVQSKNQPVYSKGKMVKHCWGCAADNKSVLYILAEPD